MYTVPLVTRPRAIQILAACAGVRSAGADPEGPALVAVTYDADLTGVRTLRTALRSQGIDAELRPSGDRAQKVCVRTHVDASALARRSRQDPVALD